MNRFTYNYLAAIQKTAIKDSERNYESSKDGGKGTAHKMTEEEKKETLSCGNYLEQKDNIFGCEPGDITKLYSLRKDLYGKMEICLLSEHLDVANQDVLQYQS